MALRVGQAVVVLGPRSQASSCLRITVAPSPASRCTSGSGLPQGPSANRLLWPIPAGRPAHQVYSRDGSPVRFGRGRVEELQPGKRRARLVGTAARDQWLQRVPTSVLHAAGDPSPAELTRPDGARRVPPRLLAAAQQGYRNGQVGLGVLAALLDEDADSLYTRLISDGIAPPAIDDDMADL